MSQSCDTDGCETRSEPTRHPDSILNADTIPTTGTLTIIAGSRSVTDHLSDTGVQQLLSSVINTAGFSPDAVISGTAAGVDTAGEQWASEHGPLPVARFPAPWNETDHPNAVIRHGQYGTYDARAGARRNEWMAEYAASAGRGTLVAILAYDEHGTPSSGTSSMIELGREYLGDENVFVVPLTGDTKHVSSELAPVVHRPSRN